MKEKIILSKTFIDVYQNFNVFNVSNEISNLSKKELYLLLICCFDHHDSDDPTVVENYSNYEFEVTEILNLQENKTTLNEFLLELISDTDSSTIETYKIELPKIFSKNEVRELKLTKILDK